MRLNPQESKNKLVKNEIIKIYKTIVYWTQRLKDRYKPLKY